MASSENNKIFTWGLTGACIFWAQNIKKPFGMGIPYLHIKPSLYEYRSVEESQIFKQNSIILIHSSFITFIVICDLQLWGGGRWVGGIWGHGGVSYTHAHTHACTHMHAHRC